MDGARAFTYVFSAGAQKFSDFQPKNAGRNSVATRLTPFVPVVLGGIFLILFVGPWLSVFLQPVVPFSISCSFLDLSLYLLMSRLALALLPPMGLTDFAIGFVGVPL